MNIHVEKAKPEKFPCELLLLFSFESPERLEGPIQSVDLEWKGFISTLIKQGDFKGELFECHLLHTQGALPAPRVLLTGLGKRGEFDLEKWRGASSKAGQFIRNAGIKQLAFPIKKFDGHSEEELAESFVTGLVLGVYQFNGFKTLEREKIKEIGEVILLAEKDKEGELIEDGLRTGQTISEAVYLTRDLVNGPSNEVTPTLLAEKAKKIAKDYEMDIQVLEVGQAEAMGMGPLSPWPREARSPGSLSSSNIIKEKDWIQSHW